MGLLSKFVGGGVAAPIEAVGNVLDKLFTSEEEKLDKQILMERLLQQPHLAQVELNKVEAQHRSTFVAGWRPFLGWVCGASFAYSYIIYPILLWIAARWAPTMSPPELVGTDVMLELVLAMLGLAGLRTAEKIVGRSK